MGKLTEIDALKRNLAAVLAAVERAAADETAMADFPHTLDALVESGNISARQIAAVGDLIGTAFMAGRLVR